MAAPMDEAEGGRQKAERGGPGPGAAPYGNFTNYYRFNPPAQRLRLLPAADLAAELAAGGGGGGGGGGEGSLALDLGCNSGDFSVAVYKHLCELGQNLKLLGCDIDADLIQRATDSNPYPESIWYLTLDVMDPVWREAALRPHLDRWQRASFDICFCMSVTMWIHLHHGDRGLLDFLRWVSGLCRTLLIEPQPWKCYRSAARRLRKLGRDTFDHFKTLAIKGDVAQRIQQFLVADCNMELVRCFGNTNWDRSLLLFKKCSLN